jgi:hypothetical protein
MALYFHLHPLPPAAVSAALPSSHTALAFVDVAVRFADRAAAIPSNNYSICVSIDCILLKVRLQGFVFMHNWCLGKTCAHTNTHVGLYVYIYIFLHTKKKRPSTLRHTHTYNNSYIQPYIHTNKRTSIHTLCLFLSIHDSLYISLNVVLHSVLSRSDHSTVS